MNNLYEKCISEIFLKGKKPLKGDYLGIELEMEPNQVHIEFNNMFSDFWNIKEDGSLIQNGTGREAVSKALPFAKLDEAIKELSNLVNFKTVTDKSLRTSLHVHLNYSDKNLVDVFTFYTLYLLLEDCLIDICGPSRKGSNFAVPTFASNQRQTLLRYVSQVDVPIFNKEERYAFFNFNSLNTFGTVEIRGMRGLNDPVEIRFWVDLLCQMYKIAQKYKNPTDLLRDAEENPNFIIPDKLYEFTNARRVREVLRSNYSNALEFSYEHPTRWDMTNPKCDFRNDPEIIKFTKERGDNLFRLTYNQAQRILNGNKKEGLVEIDFDAIRDNGIPKRIGQRILNPDQWQIQIDQMNQIGLNLPMWARVHDEPVGDEIEDEEIEEVNIVDDEDEDEEDED